MSAMMDTQDDVWMTGGGVVSERTNKLIGELISRMNRCGRAVVNAREVDGVASQILPVGHEDTLYEYRVRVLRHGPFEVADPGRFELDPEYREEER